MKELYFISTISKVSNTFNILIFVLTVLLITSIIIKLALEEDESNLLVNKLIKITITSLIIIIPLNIFVPTKKELYAIYGIGSTLDYLKSNDTAKQLPNKAILAIDKYLENVLKEENNDN